MSKAKSFKEIMSEEYAQKLTTKDNELDEEERDLLLALALSQQDSLDHSNNIEFIVSNNEKFEAPSMLENSEKFPENNINQHKPSQEPPETLDEDFLYALQLQEEFDKQKELENIKYMQAKSRENNFSKVSISYDNFRSIPSHSLTEPYSDDDDDNEEEEEVIEYDSEVVVRLDDDSNNISNNNNVSLTHNIKNNLKNIINNNKINNNNNSNGGRVTKEKYTASKKEITTKHDLLITGKLNAIHLDDQLAPNFGNLSELNVPISNAVFSTLKNHAEKTETRRIRHHGKEDRETREHVMDPRTRILLYKMLNNGLLSEVGGVLSSGKEANVYLGLSDRVPPHMLIDSTSKSSSSLGDVEEGFYAIKIYKTTLNEFKNRDLYLKYDFRFRFKNNKQNPRKFIAVWAEKERDNLIRLKNAAILCPEVVLLRKHILVMQFIGDRRGVKAPHLKDAIHSFDQHEIDRVYKECAKMMRKMYQSAKLVHADLSEYNLLYTPSDHRLFVIDLAQAVEIEHPYALSFLKRDCENINRFFENNGVSSEVLMTTKELFLFVISEHLSSIFDIVFPMIGNSDDDHHNNNNNNVNNNEINNSDDHNNNNIKNLQTEERIGKGRKNRNNQERDDVIIDEFWKRLVRLVGERGGIDQRENPAEDEVFLNGFLSRSINHTHHHHHHHSTQSNNTSHQPYYYNDMDDVILPPSSFLSIHLNNLTNNNNNIYDNNDNEGDDNEEEDDEEEFDEEYEVKVWEERPKLTRDEQKLLRKEAKKRYKEAKRNKRPPHNINNNNSVNNNSVNNNSVNNDVNNSIDDINYNIGDNNIDSLLLD